MCGEQYGAGNIKQIGGNADLYDAFNRLTAWSGPSGSGTRVYDNFGNTTSPAISGTTNHIATYTYDAAGNVLTDGIASYTYDALNATTGTNIGTRQFRYLYTPQDERIAAVERVNVSGIVRNRINWTLRSMDNRVLRIFQADYTSASRVFTVKEETFWRGGSLLASRTSAGTRHYGLDHLGSPRILTDTSGTLAGYQDFAPFGTGGTTTGGALQFTSPERDTANLAGGTADLPDYMHARYYRAGVGRFLSVDPVMNLARNAHDPQSWNRYSYTLNRPLTLWDPTGRMTITVTARDPGPLNALLYRTLLKAMLRHVGRDFTDAEVAAMEGDNYLATFLMRGGHLRQSKIAIIFPVGVGSSGSGLVGRAIMVEEGFVIAEGTPIKFSEMYFDKMQTRYSAPFTAAKEIVETATEVGPDPKGKLGFYRYSNGINEIVYNPSTGEVWHMLPLR